MKSQVLDGVGRLDKYDASRLVGPKTRVFWGQIRGNRLGRLITVPQAAQKVLTGP